MAAFPGYPTDDDVFRALADPTRRRLLDSLRAQKGQTLRELCDGVDMARQSLSKHLAVLEAAGLVTTIRRGREKLHYVNAAPINDIAERWINRYDQGRVDVLTDLKRALEDPSMTTKPSFVYTTYIRSTPERVWQALTDPAFTRRYWRTALLSDWQVGSQITWEQSGVTIADPEQVVLEADPFRRLAYTWHTFTPEFAEAVGLDAELSERLARERRPNVSFDIEPLAADTVRLTVVHDGFDADSIMVSMVSEGWPRLLSDLKSMLETGEPLSEDPARPSARERWTSASSAA
jgi:DNA-binding transcriptional ArsR family regulator/uncharacterized protein YndB with AHSA1/START domain